LSNSIIGEHERIALPELYHSATKKATAQAVANSDKKRSDKEKNKLDVFIL
jgi:hypothetical protein